MKDMKTLVQMPEDRVTRAAERVMKRAEELKELLPAQQALVVAMLEISPHSVFECQEIDDRESALAIERSSDDYPARESVALANIRAISKGSGARVTRRPDRDDFIHGRLQFGFEVQRGSNRVEVLMPSTPGPDWKVERCYIGGNSWMWQFAPEILREELVAKP